jgi:threonine aldolase
MSAPHPIIDLRSDTVTRPTEAMRRAIASAAVGDDVYGEDPTVIELQERVAARLGVEAALFTPTGTMANQIALQVHARPGDDVIVGQSAHNWLFETGAAGALAGVQMTLVGDDGRFSGSDVRAHVKPDNHHMPPTRLVCVENTHNMGGGLVWDRPALDDVLAAARACGLATHLDGARLWNAAVALGTRERELAAGFDTVAVCLSKGLGAPAGSLLAGSRAHMHEAHRIRKRLGGGMRQAGILAAAGLHALEHHHDRLAEDHDHAAQLARTLAEVPGLEVEPSRVVTNIVIVGVPGGGAQTLCDRARARGVLFGVLDDRRVRLVTHLDVDARACDRAAEVLAELTSELAAGAGT